MSSAKGTSIYWKQFLYGVLVTVKQLGMLPYFLALSCADLKLEELPDIINKLNKLGFKDKELKKLCYQERYNLLNNNAVLVARHFQYKVEVYFKEIILDDLLLETKYCAIPIEFQERVSSHVHLFIWILNASNIDNEATYIEFIEKTTNAQLPNYLTNQNFFSW